MHTLRTFYFLSVLLFLGVISDSAGANKGTYKVYNSAKVPCIFLQADIYLYLTYETPDAEKDVTVHVPTTSSVDEEFSSCDTTILTSGMSIQSQIMRLKLDHMNGWFIDFAFTKDQRFKTDHGKDYTLYQVNITANFASDPDSFPNPKNPTQHYYLHINSNELSDISSSIYAPVDNAYYCPSQQKYVVNNEDTYGPFAYIKFKLTTIQAFMTSPDIGSKITCPTDQRTLDLIPIIVGSALAGLIILTLVIYLIYRSFLPEEVINLVNPDSHFNYDNPAENAQEDESCERF